MQRKAPAIYQNVADYRVTPQGKLITIEKGNKEEKLCVYDGPQGKQVHEIIISEKKQSKNTYNQSDDEETKQSDLRFPRFNTAPDTILYCYDNEWVTTKIFALTVNQYNSSFLKDYNDSAKWEYNWPSPSILLPTNYIIEYEKYEGPIERDTCDVMYFSNNTFYLLKRDELSLIEFNSWYDWKTVSGMKISYGSACMPNYNFMVPLSSKQIALIAQDEKTSIVVVDVEKWEQSPVWDIHCKLQFNKVNRYTITQNHHTLIAKTDDAVFQLDLASFQKKKIIDINASDICVLNNKLYAFDLFRNQLTSALVLSDLSNLWVDEISQKTNNPIDVAKIIYGYMQDDIQISCNKNIEHDEADQWLFLIVACGDMKDYTSKSLLPMIQVINWVIDKKSSEKPEVLVGCLLEQKANVPEKSTWTPSFFDKKAPFKKKIDDIIKAYRKQFGKDETQYPDKYFLSAFHKLENSLDNLDSGLGLRRSRLELR